MLKLINEFNAKPHQSIESLVLFSAVVLEASTQNALIIFQNGFRPCVLQKAPTHRAVFKLSDSCRT